MNSKSTLQLLRFSPARWLLALLLAVSAWPAGAQPAAISVSRGAAVPVSAALAMPGPAPDHRLELPAVFRKAAPASMADLQAIQKCVEALVPQVSPAVVAVEVGVASGSGVIISADGLVLTAGHVCESPNRNVRFEFPDGKTARGKTLGLDDDADTGLMKITDPGPWPHVAVGDLEQARPGDWVLALGHPGGFDVKRSLVVRLGRIIRLAPGVLQTDCMISPGDSGGPLFDMQGRVIGIHTAISSSSAENFHVPITEFYDTWNQLVLTPRADGRPRPPPAYAGVSVVDDAAGCRLRAIDNNSPASKAGLKIDDVILKVEGRTLAASASFARWVAEAGPGETLALQVKRGDKLLSLNLKLQPPPQNN
ncbi:MAG: S1C family serine protease [Verrucomicrobiota bacterium]